MTPPGSSASAEAVPTVQMTVTDRNSADRLRMAVEAVQKDVASGGGVIRRSRSSLRGYINTLTPDPAKIGAYTLKKATGLVVVLVVVPALALSIGTMGAAPVGVAIIALVAFASSKLFKIAQHSRDVTKILGLLKKGEDEADFTRLNWNEVAPSLATKLEETVGSAEKIFSKLISDVKKLDTEVDSLLKAQGKKPSATDRVQVIAKLLQEEQNFHKNKTSVITALHPLSTRSGDIKNDTDRAVHRLRRLRFYLRWLIGYAGELENSAFDAVEAAKESERSIMKMASKQVSVFGRHTQCGDICWGPAEGDLLFGPEIKLPPPIPPRPGATPSSLAPPIPPRPGAPLSKQPPPIPARSGTSPSSLAPRRGALESRGIAPVATNLLQASSAKQEKVDMMVDKLIDKAVSERAAAAVASEVAKVVGDTVGEWTGGFVSDGISAAVEQARASYRVNRPLQKRMTMLQSAMHDGGVLDDDVLEVARQNDLKAVLRAFIKMHSHYPKRIDERVTKLNVHCTELTGRPSQDGNTYCKCVEMENSLRFLSKVYHQSEKQLIHIYFVKYALEAIDRQIFREAYKVIMGEALKDVVRFDKSTLTHVESREFDPLATWREINKVKAQLKSTTTKVVDPAQAIRDFYGKWQKITDLLMPQLAGSWINGAPFAGDSFKTTIQAPALAGRMIALDDWRTASSIFLRSRSPLTLQVDRALEDYATRGGTMMKKYTGYRRELPKDNKKPAIEEVLRDVQERLDTLQRGLKPKAEGWLQDKSTNQKSARRPAVLQLQVCISAEETMLSSARSLLTDTLRAGGDLGIWE